MIDLGMSIDPHKKWQKTCHSYPQWRCMSQLIKEVTIYGIQLHKWYSGVKVKHISVYLKSRLGQSFIANTDLTRFEIKEVASCNQ